MQIVRDSFQVKKGWTNNLCMTRCNNRDVAYKKWEKGLQ